MNARWIKKCEKWRKKSKRWEGKGMEQ